MAYENVFSNESATVRYETEAGYVHHTIHKPVAGQSLHDVLEKGLEALKKNGGTKWLSDDRQNEALGQEDFEFALSNWGPRAAQAGWRYWALVVPKNLAARQSMTDIVESFYSLGVRVMVFTDLEKAREWLVSQ